MVLLSLPNGTYPLGHNPTESIDLPFVIPSSSESLGDSLNLAMDGPPASFPARRFVLGAGFEVAITTTVIAHLATLQSLHSFAPHALFRWTEKVCPSLFLMLLHLLNPLNRLVHRQRPPCLPLASPPPPLSGSTSNRTTTLTPLVSCTTSTGHMVPYSCITGSQTAGLFMRYLKDNASPPSLDYDIPSTTCIHLQIRHTFNRTPNMYGTSFTTTKTHTNPLDIVLLFTERDPFLGVGFQISCFVGPGEVASASIPT